MRKQYNWMLKSRSSPDHTLVKSRFFLLLFVFFEGITFGENVAKITVILLNVATNCDNIPECMNQPAVKIYCQMNLSTRKIEIASDSKLLKQKCFFFFFPTKNKEIMKGKDNLELNFSFEDYIGTAMQFSKQWCTHTLIVFLGGWIKGWDSNM